MKSLPLASLLDWLNDFAPLELAEDWDNVGLLMGDENQAIDRVMTCLTVTRSTAREALDGGAQLIVTHHPIWFQPTQRLRADGPNGFLWSLASAGVAVYSPHTAFDNTRGGINDLIATQLGLTQIGPLQPLDPERVSKIVVFLPETDREPVLNAAFRAGAGQIGDYRECSYTVEGSGTFFPTEGTNPTIGKTGQRESVGEQRIEVVCESRRLGDALDAIRSAHSYEEPAIDVYSIEVPSKLPGVGRIGQVEPTTTQRELGARLKQFLNPYSIQSVGSADRPINRVAIACGAADSMMRDAKRAGADLLITGEVRFHRALEAEALGLGLLVTGHYASERHGVDSLALRLQESFPNLEIWACRTERDPLQIL